MLYQREWFRRTNRGAHNAERYKIDPEYREKRKAYARETMRRTRARRAAEATQKENSE